MQTLGQRLGDRDLDGGAAIVAAAAHVERLVEIRNKMDHKLEGLGNRHSRVR